jgi:hypothetical protein
VRYHQPPGLFESIQRPPPLDRRQVDDRFLVRERGDRAAIGADGAIFEACVGHVEVIGSERAAEAAREWRDALAAEEFEAANDARMRFVKAARGGPIRRAFRRAFG